jgi:small subunit ribosomal protein S6
LIVLRDYEILFIVRPDLEDEAVSEAVKAVDTLIGNLGGRTKKTDVWGRRRLAFEVKNLREGQYVLTDFEIDPQRVPEMESTLKISDTVFRHLIVRKPERPKKKAEPEAAAPAEPEHAAEPEQPVEAEPEAESGPETSETETEAAAG